MRVVRVLLLVSSLPCAVACKRSPPPASHPVAAAGSSASAPAEDAGPQVRISGAILDQQGQLAHPGIDAPLAWVFLQEDPVPTGTSPNAIVAAELPCGYQPLYASAGRAVSPLTVRFHAVFNAATVGNAPCAQRPVSVQYVSLGVVRVGAYTVTDQISHGAADPPMPEVNLHVVGDDPSLATRMARHVRACTPGRDATCTAGGWCGTHASRPTAGTCVPPLDPFLAIGRACQTGDREVVVAHVPSPGAAATEIHACLPGCDAAHACDAPLRCVALGHGQSACMR